MPGEGVFVENGGVFAGCVGRAVISSLPDGRSSVAVQPRRPQTHATSAKVGDEVLARVTKIKDETVFLAILAVNGLPTTNKFDGVVKKKDIREKEIDKLLLDRCFLPGDVVSARVCSYGDSRKIQLSTAEDHLGVLFAVCAASGHFMVPLSEEEMLCPHTGLKEKRKAALAK